MISPLELMANVVTTASIFLAGRNSVHTWWTGLIGCLLFGMLFFDAKLYADVVLQGFFFVTSLWGWQQWLRGNRGAPLVASLSDTRFIGLAAVGGLFASLGYGAILHAYTDAYAPFIDSAVLAFSVVAQILLMRRRIETWMFWLLVNTLAVPLYASRELYLTAGLYAVYWINAAVAWQYWRKEAGFANA